MFDTPIVINNFNRLTLTKRLAEDLKLRGYKDIHILDNNSTYPKLLEWYDSEDCKLNYTVKRLKDNHGALSIYNSDYINTWLHKKTWIAYTDCDIVLNPLCPNNFIAVMMLFATKYQVNKAGLALKINDLPDNLYGNHYREWEHRYWTKKAELEKDVYNAAVDTTFCIIKPGQPFDYVAIRIGGNFTAKHQPWYTDFNNLDEEESYYLQHCSNNSSYKRFWNNEILRRQPFI